MRSPSEIGVIEVEEKIRRIAELVKEILKELGEDVNREGIRETPYRVARMLLQELLYGYYVDPRQYLKSFAIDDDEGVIKVNGFVVVTNIPFRSLCEHHLLPIIGLVHIAYIPQNRVLGLSKFVRIVDAFARRLQIQERLTEQIAEFMYREVAPEGVMVVTEAIHTCTIMRGVKEPIKTVAITLRGRFAEDQVLRMQALNIVSLARRGTPLKEFEDLVK